MPYLYLFISTISCSLVNILASCFNRKNQGRANSTNFYNFALLFTVFCFWLILFIIKFDFNAQVLWYSLLFATSFTVCNVGLINALKTGSVILTSLFVQLSLIIVSIWGFIFWNAKFTILAVVGLIITAISIVLCVYKGKGQEKIKISAKWIFFVLLAMFGNAGCSIVQRTQQVNFNGQYGELLMMVATGLSLICFTFICFSKDKSDLKLIAKTSWYIPVSAGICNAIVNLLVIIMATSTLSPSLVYPVLGVGTLIITLLFSIIVLKEKARWWQWIGIVLGMVATGILSI